MAFELAIERRRLDGTTPCAGVKGPKFEPRERALDAIDLQKLLAWLPTSALSSNVYNALVFQLLTGTRSGEVVHAEWSEIDLAEALWKQPKSKTKNKREHRVMLPLQSVPCYARVRACVRASMFARSIRPTTIVLCCRKRSDLRRSRRAWRLSASRIEFPGHGGYRHAMAHLEDAERGFARKIYASERRSLAANSVSNNVASVENCNRTPP